MKDFVFKTIVSFGYLGYAPVLKGTVGTLAGLFVYLGLLNVTIFSPWEISIGGTIIFSILTVGLGKWAEKYYRRKDPPHCILDEMAGVFITCLFLDITKSILWRLALIFGFFRFFDGVKPFPIRQSQALPNGWGILIDDLLAGVCANICIQIIIYLVRVA